MPKIPQSEVRDSDFGDLATADQAALAEAAEKSRALAHYSAQAAKAGEMFKDADYSSSYEVSNRVNRTGDVWRYVSATKYGAVNLCTVAPGLTASSKLTPDEAEALGLELIAAAVEARIAVSREAA
ncbi:MAG TPA: hypothetical protein PLL72_00335 [Burkholderiaceae bacterium]|nr:hypothetical protein [Burkholderiaceae bacterium]